MSDFLVQGPRCKKQPVNSESRLCSRPFFPRPTFPTVAETRVVLWAACVCCPLMAIFTSTAGSPWPCRAPDLASPGCLCSWASWSTLGRLRILLSAKADRVVTYPTWLGEVGLLSFPGPLVLNLQATPLPCALLLPTALGLLLAP